MIKHDFAFAKYIIMTARSKCTTLSSSRLWLHCPGGFRRNSSRRPPLRKSPRISKPPLSPGFFSFFFISTRWGINKHCVCAPLGYIMEYYMSEIPLFSSFSLVVAPKEGVCVQDTYCKYLWYPISCSGTMIIRPIVCEKARAQFIKIVERC